MQHDACHTTNIASKQVSHSIAWQSHRNHWQDWYVAMDLVLKIWMFRWGNCMGWMICHVLYLGSICSGCHTWSNFNLAWVCSWFIRHWKEWVRANTTCFAQLWCYMDVNHNSKAIQWFSWVGQVCCSIHFHLPCPLRSLTFQVICAAALPAASHMTARMKAVWKCWEKLGG